MLSMVNRCGQHNRRICSALGECLVSRSRKKPVFCRFCLYDHAYWPPRCLNLWIWQSLQTTDKWKEPITLPLAHAHGVTKELPLEVCCMYALVPNASISLFEVGLFEGSLSKHSMISPGRISRASAERDCSIVIRWSLRRSTSVTVLWERWLGWRNGTLGSSCSIHEQNEQKIFQFSLFSWLIDESWN